MRLFYFQAAARHQCTYLVHLHTAEYLQAGGDRSWLSSLDSVPAKLRNLQELNRLLAHRPWLVNRQHIEVYLLYMSPPLLPLPLLPFSPSIQLNLLYMSPPPFYFLFPSASSHQHLPSASTLLQLL